MRGLVKRPEPPISPGAGLLRRHHFQVAYVTNDLDSACKVFGPHYGIERFSFLEGPMAAGGEIRVAFAWAGGTMYEIIDAKGPGTGFYTSSLPSAAFAIRFHHLGFLIHCQDDWLALEQEVEQRGMSIVFESRTPGFMDAIYIEAPEFEHYLEYILPHPSGVAFFEAVPVN